MNVTDLLFSSPDGNQCLLLTTPAVQAILDWIHQWHPLETGGILLGTYAANYRLATVHLAAPPPSDSQHGLTDFIRGTEGISELLDWAHQEPVPYIYLGEWHTHPLKKPQASRTDIRQMNAFAADYLYGSSTPVLLIIGGRPPHKLEWQVTLHSAHSAHKSLHII